MPEDFILYQVDLIRPTSSKTQTKVTSKSEQDDTRHIQILLRFRQSNQEVKRPPFDPL